MEKISIFIPSLERGGIERNIVYLGKGLLSEGYRVDLLVSHIAEPFLKQMPSSVRIVRLGAGNVVPSFLGAIPYRVRLAISLLPSLLAYLCRERPKVLISFQSSVLAVWVRELLRLNTRLIVRESNTPSEATAWDKHWFGRIVPYLKHWSYPRADAIVAVSEGVAQDLVRVIGIPRKCIDVIYNPVFDDSILEKVKEPLDHPWFGREGPPVILGIGRLTRQKDFGTLLRAFALVKRELPARLVILGEGEDRAQLEALAKELGVYKDMEMPGFVGNPYKYLAKANLFVLSSRYEGMPNVLVEALAVGTPAIATDCPSGPDEILPGEALVPVSDDRKMAEKIKDLLKNRNKAARILKKARKNLYRFRPETSLKKYLALVQGSKK